MGRSDSEEEAGLREGRLRVSSMVNARRMVWPGGAVELDVVAALGVSSAIVTRWIRRDAVLKSRRGYWKVKS